MSATSHGQARARLGKDGVLRMKGVALLLAAVVSTALIEGLL